MSISERTPRNVVSRRDWLRAGAAGTAAGLLSAGAGAAHADTRAARRRVLRIAHLTDVHVQPELAADQGLIACLHHVQNLDDPPDVIFNGGDAIMDCLATDADRTRLQFDLWRTVLRQECSIPVESCIGNHDVWGWIQDRSGATGQEPLYGKQWAVEAFGLPAPYRSFDRAGWHFVVLDSTHDSPDFAYQARLDDAQFDWLTDDLKQVDPQTPVCILSHIPIFCACVLIHAREETQRREWRVPDWLMHIDARRLMNLFLKHPNVRLCLSGHLHLVDRVDYNGVSYLCNGAVSGAWWKGKFYECDAGYALVDLFDDGSFERQYITYGWEAKG